MKIIKEGKGKQPTKKHKCKKCETKFEYDNSDIQQDRDGTYVECPVCQKFIYADYIPLK